MILNSISSVAKTCQTLQLLFFYRNDQLDMQQRQMATLLAKFRIDYSDVIVIPDVTKKADPATKAEFQALIAGSDIGEEELEKEREKTNR